MDFKFSKDAGDSQQEAPDEKKKQSALVLLLLILIGGFTYVYFFTGLIKPQENQKTVEAPVTAPQIVKMPLPPRDGEATKPAEKGAVPGDAPKAAAPTVVATAVPAAKPAVAPIKAAAAPPAAPAKPAAAPAVKAATTPLPVKAKEEPKKAAVVKPAEKKPLPVTAAENKSVPPAPKAEAKKTAETDKKGTAAKTKAELKPKTEAPGPWSLVVGNYVLEEALSADMVRVRKSGFEPVVKTATRKKTTMNRLFVSEFNDRASAQSTLEKLRRLTSDAFVIEQGGKFVVYAGSYLQGGAANSEKDRLKASGFATTLKYAEIAIPSQSLSVGPFPNKKAADAARAKLKNAGIKAALSQP